MLVTLALLETSPELSRQLCLGLQRIGVKGPGFLADQPFAKSFVKNDQATGLFHRVATQPHAHAAHVFTAELQNFGRQLQRQRARGRQKQPQQRLHVSGEVFAEPMFEAPVIAAVQAGDPRLHLVQLCRLQRAFFQGLLDHAQVKHHALALGHERIGKFFLIGGRQVAQAAQHHDPARDAFAQIGPVAGIIGGDLERFEASKVAGHQGVGPARDNQADPVRQMQKLVGQQACHVVALLRFDAHLVQRIAQDHELVLARNQAGQRRGQKFPEKIPETLFGQAFLGLADLRFPGSLEQPQARQKPRAVVVPALGELEGQRAHGLQRITQLDALVVAEPCADHRRAPAVREVHRQGRLAEAGAGLDPEDARVGLLVEPGIKSLEAPLAADEPLEVLGELRVEIRWPKHPPQHLGLRRETGALALDFADNLQQLLLVEALEGARIFLQEFPPLAQVGPLQVGDGHRQAVGWNMLHHDRIDRAKVLQRHGNLVAADPGVARRVD